MILLDTSFLIRALVRRSPEDARLRAWLKDGETLGIAAQAWMEFLCGPVSRDTIDAATELVQQPEPFDAHDAGVAAGLFIDSGRRRGTLIDCMIVARAMKIDAALATSNRADFARFVSLGLKLAE